MKFERIGWRVSKENFEGVTLSSDEGLMLLCLTYRRIGLPEALIVALHDSLDPTAITYELTDLMAQRLYGLFCGYED